MIEYGTDYPDPDDNGADLLDELHTALTRYVIFPSPEAADAVTLYIATTHAQTAWEHATRLVIKSPIKRCGKTRLQEVCRETVHHPLPTTNISPAALARSITEADPPTLILDEADTVWGKKDQRTEGAEDLRGILNSGHSRGWPYIRWDAAARKRELCPTFAMAIIGGIGDMPDTIEDRAVVISMRRRAPGERVTRWRTRRVVPKLRSIRNRLHDWVDGHAADLANAEPELPVDDRAADCWEPLAAIADAAGGSWPERARKACQTLAGDPENDEPDTAGELLLAQLRPIFGAASFLYSATIISELVKIEEAPWAEWRRSGPNREPINQRGLAALLKPYGVKPRSGREYGTGESKRGYYAADLAEAWASYVTDQADPRHARHTATDEPSQPTLPAETSVADPVAHSSQASATDDVADAVAHGCADTATGVDQPLSPAVADVADVADRGPEEGPDERGCVDCPPDAPSPRSLLTGPDDGQVRCRRHYFARKEAS